MFHILSEQLKEKLFKLRNELRKHICPMSLKADSWALELYLLTWVFIVNLPQIKSFAVEFRINAIKRILINFTFSSLIRIVKIWVLVPSEFFYFIVKNKIILQTFEKIIIKEFIGKLGILFYYTADFH